MEVKLLELRNSAGALQKLVDSDLKVRVSYKIAKLSKDVQEELEVLNKEIQKIYEKYGEEVPEGIKVIEGKEEEAQKALEDLLQMRITLNHEEVTVEEIEDVKLTAREINDLSWLIKEI